jgi:hypothetical protein
MRIAIIFEIILPEEMHSRSRNAFSRKKCILPQEMKDIGFPMDAHHTAATRRSIPSLMAGAFALPSASRPLKECLFGFFRSRHERREEPARQVM